LGGYLSGPGGEGQGISAAVAAGFATDDLHRAVKAFVPEHQALVRLWSRRAGIGLPMLNLQHSGNILLIFWPVTSPGFVLETSGTLSPATWVLVPYSPIQIGDQYLIPLEMSGTKGFYRLRFPGP